MSCLLWVWQLEHHSIPGIACLHEGYLEMQTRLGDRLANGLSKLGDDYLLGLVNRVEGAGENQG